MKLNIISKFLFLFICFLFVDGILGQPQVLVRPQVLGVGGGDQPIFTTYPSMTGLQQMLVQQQQPSLLQLVRQQQLGLINGGLTQVVGQPGVTQLLSNGGGIGVNQPLIISSNGVGQPGVAQLLSNGGGIGVNQPLIISSNGVGLTGTSTLPYQTGGLTTANINGVPVIIASSPSALASLGLTGINMNGLQTLQQPVVSVNPLLREVTEEEEMDPMDAALLDLENKGQMHMEKYAWGRSGLKHLPPTGDRPASSDGTKEQRSAGVPIYYKTLPTVSAGLGPSSSSPPTRVRTPSNPFVDGAGKRKKHFELYQYFRNMDLNSPRMLVPVGGGIMA